MLVSDSITFFAESFSFFTSTVISSQHCTCNLNKTVSQWCAKNIVPDWPGHVDFPALLVNCTLYFSL